MHPHIARPSSLPNIQHIFKCILKLLADGCRRRHRSGFCFLQGCVHVYPACGYIRERPQCCPRRSTPERFLQASDHDPQEFHVVPCLECTISGTRNHAAHAATDVHFSAAASVHSAVMFFKESGTLQVRLQYAAVIVFMPCISASSSSRTMTCTSK